MAILQNKIITHLLTLIENGQHGDVLPSQNELRRQFNVSTVTVRKALEKLEENGDIFRLQGKGCFIRRPQDRGMSTRMFLIIPCKFTLDNEFIASLINATQEVRYHTVFYHFDGSEETMIHEIRRFAPHVVMWLAPSIYLYEKTLIKLLAMPSHLVLFNRNYDHPAINYISGDFVRDGRTMARELLRRGNRNVLYLSLDNRMMFANKRGVGLQEEVVAGGGDFQLLNVGDVNGKTGIDRDSYKLLKEKLTEYLQKNVVDAIVCSQGQIWDTMLEAIAAVGKKPEDFTLCTFNRLPGNKKITDKMLIFDQPIARMAVEAVNLSSRLLAGGKPEQILFASEQLPATS